MEGDLFKIKKKKKGGKKAKNLKKKEKKREKIRIKKVLKSKKKKKEIKSPMQFRLLNGHTESARAVLPFSAQQSLEDAYKKCRNSNVF